jgi:DNA-binding MarR family transcriptional regulator
MIITSSFLAVGGYVLYTKGLINFSRSSNVVHAIEFAKKLPSNTQNVIKTIFGSSTDSYYIIGANFISKKRISSELDKVIPSELYDHKFLLHPMRLAMCRILIEHTTVPTVKLREMMGVSWSDLSTHTRAMNYKNLIHIEEVVDNDKFVQVISLEPSGLQQYQKLTQILLEVIDESLLFDVYLKEIGSETTKEDN